MALRSVTFGLLEPARGLLATCSRPARGLLGQAPVRPPAGRRHTTNGPT